VGLRKEQNRDTAKWLMKMIYGHIFIMPGACEGVAL
jgi:hypothetical protein